MQLWDWSTWCLCLEPPVPTWQIDWWTWHSQWASEEWVNSCTSVWVPGSITCMWSRCRMASVDLALSLGWKKNVEEINGRKECKAVSLGCGFLYLMMKNWDRIWWKSCKKLWRQDLCCFGLFPLLKLENWREPEDWLEEHSRNLQSGALVAKGWYFSQSFLLLYGH